MTVAEDLAAAFASDDAVSVIGVSTASESVIGQVRGVSRPFTLLVVDRDVAPVDRAMILAAIGPLAIELGPDRRLGAIDLRGDASGEDILSAARFLTDAGSTTGQVLAVTS